MLDIFIRVNSGGTQLSYSDLLLSIATAQWSGRDARSEIYGLVDDLNHTGAGFRFTKDLVLKSGLVLAGVPDIGFKVKNFTADNMALLNEQWDKIRASLQLAVALLHDFGLSGASMPSTSALIPVANYVHVRGLTQSYREAPGEAEDRRKLRSWVLRSQVVPGIWGSGLDGVLKALREAIVTEGAKGFPVVAVEAAMAKRNKALVVTPEVLEVLLNKRYGDPVTFALLAILFPNVNTRNVHHVDHVFPQDRFKMKSLTAQGLTKADAGQLSFNGDSLANLQLLEGLENISKRAKLPTQWAQEAYPTQDALDHYLHVNLLPFLPEGPEGFATFLHERRELLKTRLTQQLVVAGESSEPVMESLVPLDESPEGASTLE